MTDAALNNNTASNRPEVHVDTIVPTVEVTGVPEDEKNAAFDITITFSEVVNGFTIEDITLTGPAAIVLKSGSDGDTEYTATITPDDDSEGDVAIQVGADVVTDAALNNNTASNKPEVHIDTIPPTVQITNVPLTVQLEMFSVTVEFSEDVLEFVLGDITFSGDAVVVVETSELNGTGSIYTLTITPHEDTDGNVIIEVPENVANDQATNPNTASGEQTVFVAPKWIPDPNLRTVVRETLGLDEDEDFAREQLENLTTLDGSRHRIMDLTGLEYATDLTDLNLNDNDITDLSPLADLTNLTDLNLNNNDISDIQPLTELTELTILELNENRVNDLTPLTGLTQLRTLDLRENLIIGLEPLDGLTALTDLNLATNRIRDVSPLVGLKNLITLQITENPIVNVALLTGLAETVEADVVVPSLIADPALRNEIRTVLGVTDTQRLSVPVLQNLTVLQAESKDISDLTGLEHATALTTLDLSGNAITDITPLESLSTLTTLDLSGNAIIDIAPLESLSTLTTLDLSGNAIADITPLETLSTLTTLDLSGNAIIDIAPLKSLAELMALNLSYNPIDDLDPLVKLIGLTTLELSGNSINNLGVVSHLTGLLKLKLSDNAITDITLLAGLTGLTALDLSRNTISDLMPLAELTQLTTLNLNENSVSNLTPLAGLVNLTTLQLRKNTISILNPISTLRSLIILDLNNNNVSDLSALSALTQLTTLDLSANSISNVKPLAKLENLMILRLAGNPILNTTSLYPLTQRVPPVDIDIVVSEYPPWDVNRDRSVNTIDSALVKAAIGQSGEDIVNPRTDVNTDGTVDNTDLQLVTNNFDEDKFDEEEPRAAPSAVGGGESISLDIETLLTLDKNTLQAQLEMLRAESDGSLEYQQAIALLEAILAGLSPKQTRLLANYPNPFNPDTWIPYQLANSGKVQIFIYNTRGAIVRHLELGHQTAGYYTEKKRAAYWDGRNTLGERVSSGIYFYQLQVDGTSLLRKMVILK